MQVSTYRRAGLTLVELIVVIAIIATLATITALYFPRFQEQEQVNRGADMLQGWLLIAKQQARRDGVPTGLRFTFDANRICREMVYVQQPINFAQGQYTGQYNSNPAIGQFQFPTGVDFNSEACLVLPGDYFELLGSGPLRRVLAVPAGDRLQIDTTYSSAFPAMTTTPPTGPANYRLFPQPRPIPGEQSLQLPDNTGIDNAADGSRSQAIPSRNTNTIFEVVFSPSGALVGEGTISRQVIFWVRHLAPNVNANTLITVQPRTGFIAAHPVASGSNPFQFTQDARSSGM